MQQCPAPPPPRPPPPPPPCSQVGSLQLYQLQLDAQALLQEEHGRLSRK